MHKRYRVKVVEKHSDIVEVIAKSRDQARDMAIGESNCQYESLYECEILDEQDEEND